jgi:hypothetical protein
MLINKQIGTESLAKRLNLLLIKFKRKLTKLRVRSRLQLVSSMLKKRSTSILAIPDCNHCY